MGGARPCGTREEDSLAPCPGSLLWVGSREEPQRGLEVQLCSATGVIDKQGTKMSGCRQSKVVCVSELQTQW